MRIVVDNLIFLVNCYLPGQAKYRDIVIDNGLCNNSDNSSLSNR